MTRVLSYTLAVSNLQVSFLGYCRDASAQGDTSDRQALTIYTHNDLNKTTAFFYPYRLQCFARVGYGKEYAV